MFILKMCTSLSITFSLSKTHSLTNVTLRMSHYWYHIVSYVSIDPLDHEALGKKKY